MRGDHAVRTTQEHDHASEGHDPMCPRADIDEAWNGATCHCSLIRLLRGVDGVETVRVDFATMLTDTQTRDTLAEIEEGVMREIRDADRITQGHDPLCPPGLKAAPPDRCTWCLTIRQAREEGPLT